MFQNQSKMKYPLLLLLVVILFILKGFLIAGIFPIFQGPDEPVHHGTVQYFAEPENKTWEIIEDENEDVYGNINTFNLSEEIKQTANILKFNETTFKKNNVQEFSDGSYSGKLEKEIKANAWKHYTDIYPPRSASGNPLYYFLASLIEKAFSSDNILVRFFLIRFLSVFLGALVITLVYFISRKIGFSQNISLLLSVIVAFQPMFSFMSAIVNLDILLFFAFTLFTYGAVCLLKDGIAAKNILILVVSTVIGFLTKGSGIVLIITLYLLLAYAIYKRVAIKKTLFILYFALFSLSLAIISFIIIPKSYLKDITGFQAESKFKSVSTSLHKYLDKTANVPKIKYVVESYWGNFGWLDTKISGSIVDFIFVVEIIGFLGMFWYLFSRKKRLDYLPEKKYFVLFLLLILALQLAIRFYDWQVFNNTGKIMIDTPGRYFMPNIAAHFIILLSGLAVFLRKKEYFELLLKFVFILMIILQFYSIFNLIIPRYYL